MNSLVLVVIAYSALAIHFGYRLVSYEQLLSTSAKISITTTANKQSVCVQVYCDGALYCMYFGGGAHCGLYYTSMCCFSPQIYSPCVYFGSSEVTHATWFHCMAMLIVIG